MDEKIRPYHFDRGDPVRNLAAVAAVDTDNPAVIVVTAIDLDKE